MVVAMITDFGRDLYPGIMKSVIREISPDTKIIDITHDLPPQDIKAASYIARASHRRLPKDSVILVVVDPGVGTERRILLVKAEAKDYRYYFVLPDNGTISVVRKYVKEILKGSLEAYAVKLEEMSGSSISRTFHGRDLFAPLAARVASLVNKKSFEEIVEELSLEKIEPKIEAYDLQIAALGKLKVAFVDRFGDIVLNSLRRDPKIGLDKREELLKHKALKVKSSYGIYKLSVKRFYDPSERLVATIGSRGLLELAKPYGSAASIIGEDLEEVYIEPIG